jgi:antitoxin (DNA-binding transcriptional repressor) of toxin-antitoxin stability system
VIVKTLEATSAAANFPGILEAVQSLHESFAIVKKGVPCAYLVPAGERHISSHDLAEDLGASQFQAEDRRSFAASLRKGRKALKPLRNPWG